MQGAGVPLTSVGHRKDGVLRDAHAQGNLPELLQQAFPKLRLPPCEGEAGITPRTTGTWTGRARADFALGFSFPASLKTIGPIQSL